MSDLQRDQLIRALAEDGLISFSICWRAGALPISKTVTAFR